MAEVADEDKIAPFRKGARGRKLSGVVQERRQLQLVRREAKARDEQLLLPRRHQQNLLDAGSTAHRVTSGAQLTR